MRGKLAVKSYARALTRDRRGRVFLDGLFVDYEAEVETFRALAARYLVGQLRECSEAGADGPLFVVDSTTAERAGEPGEWKHEMVTLPVHRP